jgi:hypothetical protein
MHKLPIHSYKSSRGIVALIQGEVKNMSATPLNNLKVSTTFRDSKGIFISYSGEVYIQYRPLMPSQVSPFDVGGDYNPLIRSAQLAFSYSQTDPPFGNEAITFSGTTTAECTNE